MENFVENASANQQIIKIKSLINRGFSDAEIAHLMEKEGETNLKYNSKSWNSKDILEIRLDFGFGSNSESGVLKEKIRNTKWAAGLIGAALLIVGVFAPIIRIPIVGSINYFNNGQGDGVFVLVIALISLFFVITRKYKWVLWSGIISMAIIFTSYVGFQLKLGEVKSDIGAELAGNPFRGLADAAVNSVQTQWGFSVLIIGALLLIISAVIDEDVL